MENLNKFQCPQCGSTTTTKISEGVYHCPYCESNFDVDVSKQDVFASFVKSSQQNQTNPAENFAAMKMKIAADGIAAARKKGRIAVVIALAVVMFIAGMAGFIITKAAKKTAANGLVENSTLNKFAVFSGSKGVAVWLLQEQSKSMQDSTHYILTIVDPQTKKQLNEIEFIPAMTWEGAFDASKSIGDFYPFGDTCWIISETNGLTARDIYTGKIIVDGNKLGTMFHDLSKGISKAEWGYSTRCFNLTTNDGFEFIFYPDTKRLIKKEDADNHSSENKVTRNFFILTDGNRPALFESKEKTSPFATSSKVFNSELENYKPGQRPFGMSDDVVSITAVLPDQTFFNGNVEYADNDKALILYQSSIAKKSDLHLSCISSDGKEVWNFSGKELNVFTDAFSESNSTVDFVYSKNQIVLYYPYADHNAIALDWNTGKILWTYSPGDSNK